MRNFKLYLKSFAPYILVAISAGTITVTSFKGDIVDYVREYKIEETFTNEAPNNESVNKEIVDIKEVEVKVEEKENEEIKTTESVVIAPEEQKEEEIEVLKENISSELLDVDYKFEEIDFNSLKEINDDVCAWIKVDNTPINHVVCASQDNEDYLHKDLYGKKSSSGTIFVDQTNESLDNKEYDLSDNTILYGHHMKNGKMFASICNYKKQKYYDEHKFGVVYTPDGYAYKVDFFAGFVIDGNDGSILYPNCNSKSEFNNYISELKEKSTFTSDAEVNYGDKLITLVTCSYETTNSRYVLFGSLHKQYTNEEQMSESLNNEVSNLTKSK